MAAASGGSDKATFTNVEAGTQFTVQFNPKDLKWNMSATWSPSDEVQEQDPHLTYERGDPATLSMDLVFDTSDSGDDVWSSWVADIEAFLATTYEGNDAEGKAIKRPPYCIFSWGPLNFECVVKDVDVTYVMFKPDGTPLRAEVSVSLMKRKYEDTASMNNEAIQLTAMGSMFKATGSDKTRTYTTSSGETLSQVASKTGGDTREIAEANNIEDPTEVPAGTELVVPGSKEMAEVLSAASKSEVPSSVSDSAESEPWSAGADFGSLFEEIPSLLEDHVNELGADFHAMSDLSEVTVTPDEPVEAVAEPPVRKA